VPHDASRLRAAEPDPQGTDAAGQIVTVSPDVRLLHQPGRTPRHSGVHVIVRTSL